MISISHRYAEFSPIILGAFDIPLVDESTLEDTRLQSFEKGYQAGWDDATKALRQEQSHISADFAQNLQDMSFSYFEASGKITAALRPLVIQVITKLLPSIIQKTLPLHALEQAAKLLELDHDNTIQISVSPVNIEAMERALDAEPSALFSLSAEPALSESQVYLEVNQSEREINFDDVLSEVSEALDAFFYQSAEESKNG